MTPRAELATHRRIAAWAAVTAGGVLLAFAPAVVGMATLARRDTAQLYAPIRTLVVEELRTGHLPLWNPYEGLGKPLFAEGIHSVLHPISLLGAAFAPSSVDFLILAYLVAAALGAFVLSRALGASPPASAGAGLAFALSGYSASMTGNLVFLAGLSTLPWLLAAVRSAGVGSRWGTVATALATACSFFSGDAQVALVGLMLGTLLAVDAGGRLGAARALSGMTTGVLLAAVQILATRAFLPRTYRSIQLEEWERTLWSFSPARLLEWVVPGLFAGSLDDLPAAIPANWTDYVFAESVYLGAPLLVAAGLGLTRCRRRTGLLLGVASLLLLWLALGHHLGARQLLDWVPVWNRFRYSEKLMAPLTLCACTLAALGIDAFSSGSLSLVMRRALAATALVAGALLLTLHLAPGTTEALATRALGEAGSFYRSTFTDGLPHLLFGLGALLAMDRLLVRARAQALALLVAGGAAVALPYGAHLGPREAESSPPPLRLESDGPVPRVGHLGERATRGEGLDPADPRTLPELGLLFPSVNVAHRIDTFDIYGGFLPRRLSTLVASFDNAAYRRFGLTHVVLTGPPDFASRDAARAATDGGILVQADDAIGLSVWAVPHRPWACFPAKAIASERPEDARDLLLGLVSRGAESTVVVESTEPLPTSAGRVLHAERRAGTIAVEAESDGPALLVVQDAFWPGWLATIDGQPAEILAADVLVRAVRWPPGRHRLEMIYSPPEIRLGLALSAAGAVLAVLLTVLAARRPRLDAPPHAPSS